MPCTSDVHAAYSATVWYASCTAAELHGLHRVGSGHHRCSRGVLLVDTTINEARILKTLPITSWLKGFSMFVTFQMDEESVCPGGPTSPPQEEMEVTVATQLGSLIVSPDNADPSSNAPTVSEENGDSLATALSLNGVCKTEDCDGDEDDSEDSDSDSSSSSSSSSPSALVIEDDDDEGFSQPVPIKTRDEVLPEELPAVEEVSVSLPEDVELQPVGTVSSIIQQLVVIQSLRDTPALIDDSIIFTSDRQAVGKVFEVFGPVSSPLYILRLNSVEQISSKGLKEGLTVYYAPAIKEYTGYILTQQLKLLAVQTDSNSRLAPTLRLEPRGSFSIANSTRGKHLEFNTFGPVAGAAAVTALQLAQIEIRAQIALQQLSSLATITVGNQCLNNNNNNDNNRFAAALPRQLALLSLLSRQQVSAIGFNRDTICKTFKATQPCLPAAMYHHHSQQQGPQPFSNGPRPHHQPHPNQHQNHTPSDMLTQAMGFQFPRPTQLPDELESALAIRGARDMDHRLIDHMNPPNQHQNQGSVTGINQHGTYSSSMLTSDNQGGHQQGVDWSNYQPPTKLFGSPSPSSSHQSQRHQGPQQQPESSHAGTSWTTTVSDSPSPQGRHPHGGASSGGGDGPGLYTPESAGSILASFGLSNEDLEVLSHYPDDQLTPDTLPFILRDIQINKTGKQKTVACTSSSSFSCSTHDMPQLPSHTSPSAHSRSPEVPSLLTVTQTAGKVIDYGHSSRAKDENSSRETFKREQLSNEKTVKMYPSSSGPKGDKAERRHIHLEHTEPSKHGDRDYRRASSDQQKTNREIPPPSKSRNLDRDYRHDGPKPRPSSEARSENSSRRSLSSSSGSKPHSSSSSSKTLPTPTMISDFSAVSPKVYPHTCSLCHILCDQEKDWVDHINTVNHTAACRDLRNKYPEWKPNVPRNLKEDSLLMPVTANLHQDRSRLLLLLLGKTQKGTMLITGLPEGSWSESDIIKLIQPFGTPSDIILATQIGKVLLSVSDTEIAQEIMKVHSFVPAKIEDSELKIIQVKQRIGLSTPESPVPVGWSSLLVISNVPNTPSGSSEVQKLVQRFGTVIKTLVLNNMVIFEMATAAMALSVYKRFQTFPCIIQNNPLFFSRKPDPKSSSQTKVIAAYLDSSEDLSANSKSSQMAAAPDEAQTAQKEKSECPMEDTEKDVVELEKEMKDTEETAGEDEALEDSGIKDEIQKNRPVAAVSDSSAPPDVKPETAMDTDMREISAVVSVVETEEEKELVNASEAGNDKTPAGEEKKLFSCDDKAASGKTVMKLVLPKVTQEMVNTLLVECRTRTASHPDNVANSACGLGGETSEEGGKAAPETKVPVKSGTEEETKKQEKERREREVRKEKEARERERKERERRVREREDRAKREREWDERGRREREEEKRERERRERKRTHGEGLSAPRSSCRSEGIKQSCHRDERFNNSEADNKMVVEEEEEEEFPFNMSDFVTVDEVGDVSDLAPSPSPVISMETTEGGEDAPTSVQQNDPQDTPMEVATETAMTDATVTLAEEQVSECGPASAAAAAGSSDSSASSAPTPGEVLAAAVSTSLLASQADSSPSQSPEAPDSEATLIAAPEFEHLPMPAPAASDNPPEPAPAENPSNSPATGPVPADSEGDKKEDSQAEEGAGVLDKLEEREKRHDQVDKNTGAPAAETGMEFLVPKTGFFCKVCNRFFSGTKEAELSHCKTVKHYESLRKYLQSPKTVNVITKP
ncbi:hypothetical protein F2P81_010850 [Scophthalmus maximus]|uniref:H/ACA ribonucleoprotein complex non-core subunit NAF1 n=1 Tax=Scophthalmus maximus TaxID=52904 RepID=A0A6A4SS01_SCOMX|nr:hypothetical protein F2P81_010850 [Scophthalmus maximus]